MAEQMTIQQRIEALEGDPVIFVGSNSGFFFIGTREEYEKDIDSISKRLLANMEKKLAELITFKNNFPKRLAELKKINPDTIEAEELKKIAVSTSKISGAARKMIKVLEQIPKLEKNIANFKPVRMRIAEEPFLRLQGDGIILKVEGCENASYWFREEYQNGGTEDSYEEDEK